MFSTAQRGQITTVETNQHRQSTGVTGGSRQRCHSSVGSLVNVSRLEGRTLALLRGSALQTALQTSNCTPNCTSALLAPEGGVQIALQIVLPYFPDQKVESTSHSKLYFRTSRTRRWNPDRTPKRTTVLQTVLQTVLVHATIVYFFDGLAMFLGR